MNKTDIISTAKRMIGRMSRITVSREATADYTIAVAGESKPRFSAHVTSHISPTLAALAAAILAVSVVSLLHRR